MELAYLQLIIILDSLVKLVIKYKIHTQFEKLISKWQLVYFCFATKWIFISICSITHSTCDINNSNKFHTELELGKMFSRNSIISLTHKTDFQTKKT